MLSDSEEEPVSSNSYDYSESGLCAQRGWGHQGRAGGTEWGDGVHESSLTSHCTTVEPGPGLFLLPEVWQDLGEQRGSPGG